MSAITEALNPFLSSELVPGTKVDGTYVEFPKATIYSALDSPGQSAGGLVLSSLRRTEAYAVVVDSQWDLTVYAAQVTLATDLINPGRTIRIYCDRLCVMAGADGKALRIDVSSVLDKAVYDQPLVPLPRSDAAAGGAASGADISADVDLGLWSKWFASQPPGRKWGLAGEDGGRIEIVCNRMEIQGAGLVLEANGAQGFPGVCGQSRNWVAPASCGGDAGAGGDGGGGGSVSCSAYVLCDRSQKPLPPGVVLASAGAGAPGIDGQPGYAQDPDGVKYFGSEAPPAAPGSAGDADGSVPLGTFDDSYRDPNDKKVIRHAVMPDLSEAAFAAPLMFWSSLYHRVKLSYIENQAYGYRADSYPPGWDAMGPLIYGAHCFTHAYADLSLKPSTDVSKDPEKAAKSTIASAINVMMGWWRDGRTMWGDNISYVPSLPWATKLNLLKGGYDNQKDVRDLYIKIRKSFDQSIADQQNVQRMIDAATGAVAMHRNDFQALKKQLVGDPVGDGDTLQKRLLAAQIACNAAEANVVESLKKFKKEGMEVFNFRADALVRGLESMAFVLGNPAGMGAMGALTAYSVLTEGFDTIDTNEGFQVSKNVLKKIDTFASNLDEVAKSAVNIASRSDQVKDEIILGDLSDIDAFVKQFTDAISAGQETLDAIDDYRQTIQAKNSLLTQFSNVAALMLKEYQALQTTQQKLDDLKVDPQKLASNELETVANYAHMYLTQLEKTADAIAWLRRKYSYVTFDSLSAAVYVGDASAFWAADAASYSGGDQNNDALQTSYSTVVGFEDRFAEYQSKQRGLLDQSPPNDNARSAFYIELDGADPDQQKLLQSLLTSEAPLVLTADMPRSVLPRLDASWKNKIALHNQALDFNLRVTNVVPWLEGVQTDSRKVYFTIVRKSVASIVTAEGDAMPYSFDHDLVVSFEHYTDAKVDDRTNDKHAGTGFGKVADSWIDTRGVFGQYSFVLNGKDDPTSDNYKLRTDDITNVKLRVEFWCTYQTVGQNKQTPGTGV